MGGQSSKQSRKNPYAGKSTGKDIQHLKRQKETTNKVVATPLTVQTSVEKPVAAEESPRLSARYENVSDDEFYDGIPQYQKSLYQNSRSLRGRKVSEVSSILGRAGSAGLGRAVEVLDTLGSSVTNLNLKSGFASGTTIKNSELSILAFEVANTIVKGSNLMQSLSKRSIRQLKEVVLLEEGVQQLISKDMDELLKIVAADKREELKLFSGEVVRFGNRCKDPQWHDLDRFFEKRSRDRTPQKQLKETAESVMLQLMTSVQLTAELYQDLHTLDRIEQEYQLKRLEELRFNPAQRGDRDNRVNVLAADLKRQRKVVKNLQKKSLWSKNMEEVMGQLVDITLFLNQEINYTFGNPAETETPEKGTISNKQKLGPAGLSLHYANIILQIDLIVARSSSMSPNSRETLYQSLPPDIKDSLRSKLQAFHVEKELTVREIKDEMEKTLHWLACVATNTAKAHHGFGWVGEWANNGSELNHRTVSSLTDVMQIETLHHADKQKIDDCILDLLLWLNYLVNRSKAIIANRRVDVKPSTKKPVIKDATVAPTLSGPNQQLVENANCGNQSEELSNTCHVDIEEKKGEKVDADELATPIEERSSHDDLVHLGHGYEMSLDAIDRV